MLGPRTMRLLTVASDALGQQSHRPAGSSRLAAELSELLEARNGFYAFESALHVFPVEPASTETLETWNAADGWRAAYGGMAKGLLFFAEDVFGGQFALRGDDVCTFDPETGDLARMATSLEDWAGQVLDRYSVLTGHPLAHDWQIAHSPLEPGKRLVPTVPFVIGATTSSTTCEQSMRRSPCDSAPSWPCKSDTSRKAPRFGSGSRTSEWRPNAKVARSSVVCCPRVQPPRSRSWSTRR